jgi:hypothetical protein
MDYQDSYVGANFILRQVDRRTFLLFRFLLHLQISSLSEQLEIVVLRFPTSVKNSVQRVSDKNGLSQRNRTSQH